MCRTVFRSGQFDVSDVSIFIVDNNDRAELWQARLADAPDHAAGRAFVFFEQIAKTARSARAWLRPALDDRELPQLIVLDHHLGQDTSIWQESGLGVLRWLRDECAVTGLPLPRCVLWTGDFDLPLSYAAHQSGAWATFSKLDDTTRVIERLWEIVDDPREEPLPWEHPRRGPSLKLGERVAACLPYFHADLSTYEIARLMREHGELAQPDDTLATNWVNDQRSRLRQGCNDFAAKIGDPRTFGSGQQRALADFALEMGQIWSPLRYREATE